MVWGALALLGALSLIGGGVIRWLATEVGVFNGRVLAKTGLFAWRSIKVLLTKVESIALEEPLLGRTLGYGTVIVRGIDGIQANRGFALEVAPDGRWGQAQKLAGLPRLRAEVVVPAALGMRARGLERVSQSVDE